MFDSYAPYRQPMDSPNRVAPLHPASPWARGVAAGLDLVFLLLLYGGAAAITGLHLWADTAQQNLPPILSILLALFLSLLSFPLFVLGYFWVMHGWQGQTIGKMFLGIRVVALDGGDLSLGCSFLRLIGYALSLLPLGVGFLWGLFHPQHRCWHDLLATTLVVEK